MARRFVTNIDLAYYSILNALINPVASDPTGLTSAQAGMVWFNSTTFRLKFWDGTTAWDLRDRGAQTGTQTAATISDLASVVKAYRLNEFAAPTAAVSLGSQKITSLADPTSAQDAATKNYVDVQFAGQASGLVIKGSVRVATTSNVSISAAPSTIDGVTLANGDIVLLAGQSTASQNGPRVFTAAGAALNRAANFDTNAEAQLGSFWIVLAGTYADTFAVLSNDTAITLDTTALTFVFRGTTGAAYTAGMGLTLSGTEFRANPGLGISIPATAGSSIAVDTTVVGRKVVASIPASTAAPFSVSGTTVTINHALANSAAWLNVVYGNSPPPGGTAGYPVEVEWMNSDPNNTVVTLPAAPGANQYVAYIQG